MSDKILSWFWGSIQAAHGKVLSQSQKNLHYNTSVRRIQLWANLYENSDFVDMLHERISDQLQHLKLMYGLSGWYATTR